jgi:hypothetical protein
VETLKETLNMIAYGVFDTFNATISVGTNVHGPLIVTTSGGGNYSPPQPDDFPFGTDA